MRVCGRARAGALVARVSLDGVEAGAAEFGFLEVIFALREVVSVLTFFQLVKNPANTCSRQAPVNMTDEFK